MSACGASTTFALGATIIVVVSGVALALLVLVSKMSSVLAAASGGIY